MLINLDDTISSRDNMGSESNLDHGEDEKKYVELNLSGNRNNYNEFPTVLIIKFPECFRFLYCFDFIGYSELVDVTVPVQSLVESGRLTFFEGSKADLAGFYDPCALLHDEQKHLLIRYSYQNSVHQVLLPDGEGLKLPKTAHRISVAR